MRSSLISKSLTLPRAAAILSAALLLACVPMAIGQQQQAKPTADDKKSEEQNKPQAESRFGQKLSGQGKARLGADKPTEPTLEEMLNKALKDNPDIKVAEAKLREADAELNRVRLQVTQKVLTFHHAREAQKALVKVAENEVARIRKLPQNLLPEKDLSEAEDRLAQAKAKLAEIEAGMPYLLGQETGIVLHIGTRLPETLAEDLEGRLSVRSISKVYPVEDLVVRIPNVPATTLEKIRKALDTPVTLDLQGAVDAAGVLKDLEKKVPGISFHVVVGKTNVADFHLERPVTLAAALQMVEDTFTTTFEGGASARCAFVIRDYGILFTTADRIPPGATQLDDLIKEKAFAEKQKAWVERQKKQPEDKKPTSGKH